MAGVATGQAFHFQRLLTAEGWKRDVRLTLAQGDVARLDEGAAPAPGDDTLGIGIAGMPNLHSHAFQRAMAGLAEMRGPGADSFWTWRELMYRFAQAITPDDMHAIASLAFMEMVETGFTRVGEFHYLHSAVDGGAYADRAAMAKAIIAAAGDIGIGLTLLPVFYAHGGFGGAPPAPRQRRFVHSLDTFADLIAALEAPIAAMPGAVLGVAPHSLRAVTPDQLRVLAGLRPGQPIHIHIAEQQDEVTACLARLGARPIEWLCGAVEVDSRWCLVHATHASVAECASIAASGAVVGLCPITEANLGDGLFPAADFLGAGGTFGIGSDSNVLIDCAEELRLLEYGQRLARQARNVLASGEGVSTGEELYLGALRGGSRALGVDGALQPGTRGDFFTLAADHPAALDAPWGNPLDKLVFAAGRDGIDRVFCAGRELVSGGRHHRREETLHRYREALAGLIARS